MAYGAPSWRKLTGGIIALVAIIAGAFAIIAFARVGSLKGDTYPFTGPTLLLHVWRSGDQLGRHVSLPRRMRTQTRIRD